MNVTDAEVSKQGDEKIRAGPELFSWNVKYLLFDFLKRFTVNLSTQ